MRLRNIPGAKEAVQASPDCVLQPETLKGRWRGLFSMDGPLYVEIGTGKGRFLIESARKNPGAAYVGIERYATVLYKALRKLGDDKPRNLRFVNMDAELIGGVFDRGEADRIYLNFSDPWPKERHANRRLTSRTFLRRYEEILAPGGSVHFKTDNRDLFLWSVEEAKAAGYCFLEQTEDLHADARLFADNVMTEYEEKFSAMGHPIYMYIITKNGG